MERFYERLAEVLEEDSVGPDAVLSEFEVWDSLTALSVISMIGDHYKVTLSAEDLAGARTAGGLEAMVASKRAR